MRGKTALKIHRMRGVVLEGIERQAPVRIKPLPRIETAGNQLLAQTYRVKSPIRAGALFGVVATLLLFGCVTLHELAHSIVAMGYGIRVRGILLLPIGGVSQIEDMPDKPAQELRIALAGPLTSLAIAVVLFVVLAIAGQAASATISGLRPRSGLAPGMI